MNFSGEDRKEVFFFFEEILRSYKQPLYYENLRGHVSKAPLNVRRYVFTKCRGDNFLEYFTRRKNYFNVECGKVSLKEEFGVRKQGNSHSNTSNKKGSKGKYVRRKESYSYSSYASALKNTDSNENGEKEYETIAITYFRNRLVRKKKERLWNIYFMDLPKKVRRHLQLYYKSEVKSFLANYPDKFFLNDDDETVSLAFVCESNADTSESKNMLQENQDSSTNFNQDSTNIAIDSDIKKVSEYLECVIFFVDILKKLNQPFFPIEKLGGYFSQARKEIKDHVKMNYRSFKYFFDDAPLIFSKNTSDEVSLSKDYRKLLKAAEKLIKNATDGFTSPSEMPLKSCIDRIFQPQISSSHSSCFEEIDGNNETLPVEGMTNTDEDLFEELMQLGSHEQIQWDLPIESTDDFFDNYLMRSTSRESSFSLSSRSTRSTSIEHPLVEDNSVTKTNESDEINSNSDMEVNEYTFLRYIFTVELFCVEFMENELNYVQNYENKAVEYFIEILDTASTKVWKLSSLQGAIGNNREVAQYMNKLYKGEKFITFFQSHSQFEVEFPYIKLSLNEKENCTKDLTFSDEKNEMKDLTDIYELCDFKILLKETYAYIYEVCKFCKNKSMKVDRLSGILARFLSCLNMIKYLNGQSLHEKIEYFLQKTMIFKFPENGSILFPHDYLSNKCPILFEWFEKMNCWNSSEELVSFSDFWKNNASKNSRKNKNGCTNLEKQYHHVTDIFDAENECRSEFSYYEIHKILPECVLLAMTDGNYYSKFIVSVLLKSKEFKMKNGKISYQKISENCNTDIEDIPPAKTGNGLQNNISKESSNEFQSQQDICDINLVRHSSSLSINSEDLRKPSKELKIDVKYCSDQSSEILQTTDNCENKETDSDSVEFKSDLTRKDDKKTDNPSLISESKYENLNSMNKKTSETFKKLILQDKNKGKHICTETPLINAGSLNFTEESNVVAETSKSIPSHKPLDSVERNESVSEYICSEMPLTNAANLNFTEESKVVAGTSKSISSNKALHSVEGNKSGDEYLCTETPLTDVESLHLTQEIKVVAETPKSILNDKPLDPVEGNESDSEYLCTKTPLTEAESLNFTEEIKVVAETSKTIQSNKPLDSVKVNELVGESPVKLCRREDNINSKIVSSPQNSVILEESNVHSESLSTGFQEIESHSKRNRVLLSVCDSFANLHISKSVIKEEEIVNEQIDVSSNVFNLNSNYFTSLKEKYNNLVKPDVDLLEKECLAKHSAVCDVSNKCTVESNIKVLKEEQNISFEEEESNKYKIDLCNKQLPNSFNAKSKLAGNKIADNLTKESKAKRTFEHSYENRNLDNSKASEQVDKNTPPNDVPQVSDFNETKTETKQNHVTVQDFKKIKKLNDDLVLMNKNDSKEIPFGYTSIIPTSDNLKGTNISSTSSCNDLTSEYIMQPITAEVVLLTNNSCIAIADIKNRKQNIYFLKYTFACEHQDECADCFGTLQIGDKVSCFVPLTEISQKIWIAFMVNKDDSDILNELGNFDKQKESVQVFCEGSTKSPSFSAHLKNSVCNFGCQTDFSKCERYSQTYLIGDSDLFKATKESSCQTSSISFKHISVQTERATMTNGIQADIPFCAKCIKSQLNFNCESEKNDTSQASWLGKETQITKNVCCQTYSTGEIYMINHHPM